MSNSNVMRFLTTCVCSSMTHIKYENKIKNISKSYVLLISNKSSTSHTICSTAAMLNLSQAAFLLFGTEFLGHLSISLILHVKSYV